MTERPLSVKVGPHTYKILWEKEEWKNNLSNEEAADCNGYCWNERGLIFVKSWELSNSQLRDCLLHEVLHACFGNSMHSNLASPLPKERHDAEEDSVLFLCAPLLQVLQDNPVLVAYLVNNDD